MQMRAQESVVVDTTDYVQVSVMIASPNYERMQSSFGHMFMRMECPAWDVDYCFSFESEERPAIFSVFIGEYNVRLVRVQTSEYVSSYLQEGRTITAYPLNLTSEEKQKLWQRLDEIAREPIYSKHDYFHHGCSQELMNILYDIIDGRVVFDESMLPEGRTIQVLGSDNLPADSPILFTAMLFSTEALNHKLSPKQCIFEPLLAPTFLRAASVCDRNGNTRPLLRPYRQDDEWTTPPPAYESGFPIWGMLSIIIVLLLLLGVAEYLARVPRWLSIATDAIISAAYVGVTLLIFFVYCFSTLPTTSGWSWHFLVFNFLPIIAVPLSCTKRFRTWRRPLMATMTVAFGAYLLTMWLIGGMLNTVQSLLISIFALRTLTHLITNK